MKRKKEPAKARDEYNEKFRCISQKRSECCTWDAHTLFMPYIQLFFMRCRIVFWCMVSGIGRQYFKLCSVIWMCISHSTLSLCVLHSTLPACLPSSSTSSSSLLCVLEKKSHLNFFSHVFWTLKFKFSFLFCLFACLSSRIFENYVAIDDLSMYIWDIFLRNFDFWSDLWYLVKNLGIFYLNENFCEFLIKNCCSFLRIS